MGFCTGSVLQARQTLPSAMCSEVLIAFIGAQWLQIAHVQAAWKVTSLWKKISAFRPKTTYGRGLGNSCIQQFGGKNLMGWNCAFHLGRCSPSADGIEDGTPSSGKLGLRYTSGACKLGISLCTWEARRSSGILVGFQVRIWSSLFLVREGSSWCAVPQKMLLPLTSGFQHDPVQWQSHTQRKLSPLPPYFPPQESGSFCKPGPAWSEMPEEKASEARSFHRLCPVHHPWNSVPLRDDSFLADANCCMTHWILCIGLEEVDESYLNHSLPGEVGEWLLLSLSF